MNVFETSSGSKKIGVAPRYSGVIVVSKTSDHVQVIYEKKKHMELDGLIEVCIIRKLFHIMGNEKQLLGNGTYWIQNKASGEGIRVQIIFLGDQKYQVSNFESKQRRSHMETNT